jgi:tripartite-type tricarboxylate transporter receptor subunit TctC
MFKKKMLKMFGSLVVGLGFSVSASASNYPNKPIHLYTGYGAGGVGDVAARIITEVMEKDLGVPIVVANRPGAQATLNANLVTKHPTDGYQIGVVTFAPLAIVPHMVPVSYTPDDFTFIGGFGRNQYGLAVRADSPYKTVADLVEAGKKGKSVFFGAPGAPNNIAMYELGDKTGAKFEQVLYKSGNETVMALIGGQVEAIVQTPSEILPHVESGRLRLLASVSPARWQIRPDMPTMVEQGFDVQIESWQGMAGPKGMDPKVVARLEKALLDAMKNEGVIKKYESMGLDPVSMTGEEYGRAVRKGSEEIGKALKQLGLVPQK